MSPSATVHAKLAMRMLDDPDVAWCGETLCQSTGFNAATVSRVLADWTHRGLIIQVAVDRDPQTAPLAHLVVGAQARWRKLTANGIRQLSKFVEKFQDVQDFALGPIDRRVTHGGHQE